jgi:hypothetical protein
MNSDYSKFVIPANLGYPGSFQLKHETEVWIPAAAGMTKQTNPKISEPFQKLSA